MIELTIHGRGGQGGVTLAKLIATTYFLRGKWAQAFGVYAAERSGAPIQAYVRIDDREITNRNQIREPDHVIALDPTLIGPPIAAGLKQDGWIILNTPSSASEWARVFPGHAIATVDATAIAVKYGLGTRAVPIVNTTMLGAVARVFAIPFAEVREALADLKFGGANLDAAEAAYEACSAAAAPPGGEQVVQAAVPVALAPPMHFLDREVGAPPKVRTGSWATRRPSRRTLTPPCNHSCPAGNDVQGFIAAVAEADYDAALRLLLQTSPLPGVCGRVCPAPCMDVCNRQRLDEGVNVRELERWVADVGNRPEAVRPWRKQAVCVVGSGPAGLSASYQLARLGYPVTLLEAAAELGGVLRNGIPDYRLPKDVLDRDLAYILDHGVTFFTNERVDRATLQRLTAKYAAVFLATGLQTANAIALGEGTAGLDTVMQGIDFLDRVHQRDIDLHGQRVLVVGGGNTAVDAARSARRLGAADVRILYRRTRMEMPAIAAEIQAALDEGVELDELVVPLHLEGKDLVCTRVDLGEPDASGRRQPIVNTSAEAQFTLACDRVVLALGQSADLSILGGAAIDGGLAEPDAFPAPVFAGGDFGRNEGTVTAAIGSGRLAALHIHRALTGEDLIAADAPRVATVDDLHVQYFDYAPRQRGIELMPEHRRHTFEEVEIGFADDDCAIAEAQRCFSCGVCNDCERCIEHCPEGILARDAGGYRFDYDYCKGCGVCAAECPRGVVVMAQL